MKAARHFLLPSNYSAFAMLSIAPQITFLALRMSLRHSAPPRLRVRYKPRLIPQWRWSMAATTRFHKSSTHRREKQGSDLGHGHLFKLPGLPNPSRFHQAPIWRMIRQQPSTRSTRLKNERRIIQRCYAWHRRGGPYAGHSELRHGSLPPSPPCSHIRPAPHGRV